MQDIACMTLHACQEAWHERSTHAEKQEAETRNEMRDTRYETQRSLVHGRCSRLVCREKRGIERKMRGERESEVGERNIAWLFCFFD